MQTVHARGREIPVQTRKRRSLAHERAEAVFKQPAPQNITTLPTSLTASYGDARFQRSETVQMSFAEWEAIPSNPRQRNEIVRIDKGRADHLLSPNEKHREVALALLPDNRIYKVDGHTRTALWRSGRVMPPSYLLVDVYNCVDDQAAMDLYDLFDNTGASESGTDRVTGAFREAGINPTSPMLLEGGISTAMRELYSFVNQVNVTTQMKNTVINSAIKTYAKEIMLLDKIKPTREAFPYGIVMGAILTFARYGDKPLRFWELYQADAGSKDEGSVDAVEALVQRRKEGRGKGNTTMGRLMMNYSIKAYDHHNKGKSFSAKTLIHAMHKDKLRAFANDVRKIKGVA